ncbi:sugar transporter ERD6-like 4 [Silene latifolia]|uniref:sugar transporter ERD6-like 4 n=1 Tax=Silene latifolia TaxID=37657 RepID=UPI003D76FBB0
MSEILPVSIKGLAKGLAGSVATLANFLTSWGITMSANQMLSWSSGAITKFKIMARCSSATKIFGNMPSSIIRIIHLSASIS